MQVGKEIWKELENKVNEDLYYIEIARGEDERSIYRMYAKSANDAMNKALKNLSDGWEIKGVSTI